MQVLYTQTSPSPVLRFFLLCESVVQHDDDHLDVIGLLSDHLFTGTSAIMPLCPLPITLVVGIYSEDHSATYAFKVTSQAAGLPEKPIWKAQIGLVSDQYLPIQIEHCNHVTFHKPGTFWFRLYLDNDLVARYPLNVNYTQLVNTGTA
jgi:hypothetical protein